MAFLGGIVDQPSIRCEVIHLDRNTQKVIERTHSEVTIDEFVNAVFSSLRVEAHDGSRIEFNNLTTEFPDKEEFCTRSYYFNNEQICQEAARRLRERGIQVAFFMDPL